MELFLPERAAFWRDASTLLVADCHFGKTASFRRHGLPVPEGSTADEIIDTQGLKQVTDSGAIEAMIDDVLAANPKSVEEFRAGKDKAFNALVGQVMKASKGKASPGQVNELLKKKLGG